MLLLLFLLPLLSLQTLAALGFSSVSPTFLLSSPSSLQNPYPSSPSLCPTAPSCKWAALSTSQDNSPFPTKPLLSPVISCLISLSRILLLVCLLSFVLTAWPFSLLLLYLCSTHSASSTLPFFTGAKYPSSDLWFFTVPPIPQPPQSALFTLNPFSPSRSLCLLPASLLWLTLTLYFPPCPLPWIYPRDSPTNPQTCSQVPTPIPCHSLRSS